MFYSTRRRSAPMTPEQTFPRGRLRVVCPHDFCWEMWTEKETSSQLQTLFSIFFNIFHSQTPWPTDRSWDVTCQLTEAHLGGSTTVRFADPLVGLRSSRSQIVEQLQCKKTFVWLCRSKKWGHPTVLIFIRCHEFMVYCYIDGKCAIKTHKNTYFHQSCGRLCFGFEVKAKTFASRCWNWHCLRWALDGKDVPRCSIFFSGSWH